MSLYSVRTGYTCGNDAQKCNTNSNLVSRMVAGCTDAYFFRERKEMKLNPFNFEGISYVTSDICSTCRPKS
jgi:hypothetical protein